VCISFACWFWLFSPRKYYAVFVIKSDVFMYLVYVSFTVFLTRFTAHHHVQIGLKFFSFFKLMCELWLANKLFYYFGHFWQEILCKVEINGNFYCEVFSMKMVNTRCLAYVTLILLLSYIFCIDSVQMIRSENVSYLFKIRFRAHEMRIQQSAYKTLCNHSYFHIW